ncbi:MAG: hypothetical protein SO487_05665, partial [Alloprevotella sp.]|nr:hypothetical protein [Alloprevotella sp.]
MQHHFQIKYPASDKVYLPGRLFPDLKVAMRRVRLTPTVTRTEDG